MAQSTLSVDECFSSPRSFETQSVRLTVRVKTPGESLNIVQLKAIVDKGSRSLNDTTHITLIATESNGNGIHLSSILFVYTPTSLKTYIKRPRSISSSPAIGWLQLRLSWDINLEGLIDYFVRVMNLDKDSVSKESLYHDVILRNYSPQTLNTQINSNHKGYIGPQVMFRLWDASGREWKYPTSFG
ncbi:uncharacterized protein MELLADRAFT_68344 [Melampsora larici-populina 98AG31]|uniref:Uncharacterized protein n=1 Tax=Melampsora larici-populina (strain 98AG31 / pathotype 3-4-7) TaxID=747676 RepID=F4S6G2_MELLP|nr:uncharacterized protein MELLADRAFT_68344 [Melampsora larici-populina 98AG31]EGF99766.1 hypothetical protein MELLADRAFT_68344 [Melampsora larici-populina 98AG31]